MDRRGYETMPRNAVITGWGKCVPPAVLSNADLETVTDTSDEWITTRTGIEERRISHVETSDLAAVAGARAVAAAGLQPDDLDLIIVATCTPDRLVPSVATLVQEKLGAGRAAAMDLNAACSGFIFGLVTARQMIAAGGFSSVLVIGAEKLHFFLDFTDRSTSVLFGDGAGAVVVEPSDEDAGLLAFELGSDGSAADLLCVPNSGTEGAPGRSRRPIIRMEGPEVFRRAVAAMGDASTRVLAEAGLTLEDVDLLIPHQANIRIIDATARRLKLEPSKVYVNIGSYGNTSAATIPIALAEALDEGRIGPGDNLVLAAFGGGLTWAAAAYRWGARTEPLGSSDAALPATAAEALDLLQPNIDAYGKGV
jgi:3-oxoacyl-[acyl-carrier-protein] synthase-3